MEMQSRVPREESNEADRRTRVRIRFTKCGDLRWIGHRDLARLWERLLRRAGLQLAFSQGFHPKPRINFPSALALGIEALDEVVELELLGAFQLNAIEQDIRRQMPVGMELLRLETPSYALGKAKVLGATYRICIRVLSSVAPGERVAARGLTREDLARRIEELKGGQLLEISRDGKTITCDPRDPHFDLKLEDDFLIFSLPNATHGSVRPSELLECLGVGDLMESGIELQRIAVHLQEVIHSHASTGHTPGLAPGAHSKLPPMEPEASAYRSHRNEL